MDGGARVAEYTRGDKEITNDSLINVMPALTTASFYPSGKKILTPRQRAETHERAKIARVGRDSQVARKNF
jgi:hypothetical protein